MTFDLASRRAVLASISALPVAGLLDGLIGSTANAAMPLTIDAPRGRDGVFERLADIDSESFMDFLSGRAMWMPQLREMGANRGEAILWANGIDPAKASDMPMNDIVDLLHRDPLIARAARLGHDITYEGHSRLRDFFHANGDFYENELSRAERKGPGSLQLNPSLNPPDYTRHEIHNQVGGYMGDPFAGLIYYNGTTIINDRANAQGAMFDAIAKHMPLPANGQVRRILDNGTGPGELATAMKRRFPDAEVWGIDVSGPMVRYAHKRAVDNGVTVNFSQALAEDNGFPDNYFDIITSSSFHHELTAEASKAVFREVQRVLRPGGIFRPADSGINGYAQTPQGKVHTYVAQRVNHEVWMLEWAGMDRFGAMRDAGLKVDPNGAPGGDSSTGWWLRSINLVATKG